MEDSYVISHTELVVPTALIFSTQDAQTRALQRKGHTMQLAVYSL